MSDSSEDDARRDLAVALGPGDRVGVTGASGFIGSAVVRALIAREVPAARTPSMTFKVPPTLTS